MLCRDGCLRENELVKVGDYNGFPSIGTPDLPSTTTTSGIVMVNLWALLQWDGLVCQWMLQEGACETRQRGCVLGVELLV